MKVSRRDREVFAKLEAIYARLPRVDCQRKCGFACGPVPLTDLEARRMQLAAHQKPRTLPLVRADGTPMDRCIYLDQERVCRVYAVRPFICRVWGVVKALSCPHGCVPDRWLDDLEMLELAEQVERLGGGRLLRTSVDGLTHDPHESWQRIRATAILHQTGFRPARAREEDAERTRSLRAVFGGRIIVARRD